MLFPLHPIINIFKISMQQTDILWMILLSKARSVINGVSKKSIAETACSLMDRLQDLCIYAQALILSCDKLLSGMEISTMEMCVLLFSQLLIHTCHFHYTVPLLSSLRAGYSFFANSFTFLLSSVVLMFQSFWDFPLLLKTELCFRKSLSIPAAILQHF